MKESTSVHRRLYQPHPLPMPEYGGWFAPLTEFLPSPSVPIATFHRCNLAVVLLTDLVVDCHSVDWSAHIPLVGFSVAENYYDTTDFPLILAKLGGANQQMCD